MSSLTPSELQKTLYILSKFFNISIEEYAISLIAEMAVHGRTSKREGGGVPLGKNHPLYKRNTMNHLGATSKKSTFSEAKR